MAERTLKLATKLGCVMQYYHDDEIYANPFQDKHYELTTMYSDLTGAKTIFVNDNYQSLLQSDSFPSKLLVLCPTAELKTVWSAFQTEFKSHEATLVYGSLGWFLEVLHPNVCKGYGLQQMCRQLQWSMESVVSF